MQDRLRRQDKLFCCVEFKLLSLNFFWVDLDRHFGQNPLFQLEPNFKLANFFYGMF